MVCATGTAAATPDITGDSEILQQNEQRVFDSYEDLQGSEIQQGQTILIDFGEDAADSDIQLRQVIDSTATRLRQQIRIGEDGIAEITTEDKFAGDYFIYGRDIGVDTGLPSLNKTFSIYEDNTDRENIETDVSFDSYTELTESTIWQGQTVGVLLPVPNAEVEVYRDFNQTTSLRKKLRTDQNGLVQLRTASYSEGEFYITGAGVDPSDGSSLQTFKITKQTIETDFEQLSVEVNQDATTDLAIDSNRAEYPVTISAEGFEDISANELSSIFESSGQLTVVEENATTEGVDTITIQTTNQDGVVDFDQYNLDFSSVEQGIYTFKFDVSDATASSSSVITVKDITNDEELFRSDGSVSFESYDQVKGSVVWRGQRLIVGGLDPNGYVQLRQRVNEDTTRLRKELATNDSGYVTVETAQLGNSRDYLLTGAGIDVIGTDLSDTFNIAIQTLDVDFQQNRIGNNRLTNATFEIDSNRGIYPITVHAKGDLTAEELEQIFKSGFGEDPEIETYEGTDGITDFDEIRVQDVTDSDEYKADFTGISPNTYQLQFLGTDSTGAAESEITVVEKIRDEVEITTADIAPSTVTNSSSVHTLEINVENVSADGEPDEFSVEIPDKVGIQSVDSASIVDKPISVENSTEGNEITVEVDPESDSLTTDLVVEVDVELKKLPVPDGPEDAAEQYFTAAKDEDLASVNGALHPSLRPIEEDDFTNSEEFRVSGFEELSLREYVERLAEQSDEEESDEEINEAINDTEQYMKEVKDQVGAKEIKIIGYTYENKNESTKTGTFVVEQNSGWYYYPTFAF